jgi:hypothetical protein
MAIVVDSSQWTGQQDDTPLAVPVVWGEFENEAARKAALSRLREAGAREHGQADPAQGGVVPPVRAANEGQVDAPDEDPEGASQRNQRQLGVGMGMAATSMAAAGIVIATGGAALPAVAAAAAAGTATGVVGGAIGNAVSAETESGDKPLDAPVANGPVIGLQAPDDATRERAERLLREAGAARVFVQETRAG